LKCTSIVGIVVLSLILVVVFTATVSANEYLYMNAIEDPIGDLLNIWTGEAVEVYIDYIDIVYTSIAETEDHLIVRIVVHGEIPEMSELRIFYYVLLDADANPENNCMDPPMDYCDTMYALVVNFTSIGLSKYTYTPWGWSTASTSAKFNLENATTLVITIPKHELGLTEYPPELRWKVITELEHTCGDRAPDEGVSTLTRYAEVEIAVPLYIPFIYINGTKYYSEEGVVTLRLPPGKYELFVPSIINISKSVRLVFREWSDGIRDNPRVVHITTEGFNSSCIYEKFFKVEIRSPLGKTYGSGWYPENSEVNLGVAPSEINITKRTKVSFSHWVGKWGRNLLNPYSPKVNISKLVDPIEIEAVWIKRHLITLSSRYGEPRGGGWYTESSTALISIEKEIVFKNGTKVVFESWRGDLEDERNNLTIRVDKPYSLIATWRRYFLINLKFLDSRDRSIEPTTVKIVDEKGVVHTLTDYENIWLEEGEYRLSLVEYKTTDVKPTTPVVLRVNRPTTLSVKCRVYYLTIEVVDLLGFPVSGIKASVTLPDGTVITSSGDREVLLEQLPAGVYDVQVTGFLYDRVHRVDVHSDREITITVPLSATSLAILLGLGLSIGGGIYFLSRFFRRKCCCLKWKFDKDGGILVYGPPLISTSTSNPSTSPRIKSNSNIETGNQGKRENWLRTVPVEVEPARPIYPEEEVASDVQPIHFEEEIIVPYGGYFPLVAKAIDKDYLIATCYEIDCRSGKVTDEKEMKIVLPDMLRYRWEIIKGRGSLLTSPQFPHEHSATAEGPAVIYVAPPPPKNHYKFVEEYPLLLVNGRPQRFIPEEEVLIKLVVDDIQKKVEDLDDPDLKPRPVFEGIIKIKISDRNWYKEFEEEIIKRGRLEDADFGSLYYYTNPSLSPSVLLKAYVLSQQLSELREKLRKRREKLDEIEKIGEELKKLFEEEKIAQLKSQISTLYRFIDFWLYINSLNLRKLERLEREAHDLGIEKRSWKRELEAEKERLNSLKKKLKELSDPGKYKYLSSDEREFYKRQVEEDIEWTKKRIRLLAQRIERVNMRINDINSKKAELNKNIEGINELIYRTAENLKEKLDQLEKHEEELKAQQRWRKLVERVENLKRSIVSNRGHCKLTVQWLKDEGIIGDIIFPEKNGLKIRPGQLVIFRAWGKDTDVLKIKCCRKSSKVHCYAAETERIDEHSELSIKLNDRLFFKWSARWKEKEEHWLSDRAKIIEKIEEKFPIKKIMERVEEKLGAGVFLISDEGETVLFKAPRQNGKIIISCTIYDSGLQAVDSPLVIEREIEITGKPVCEEIRDRIEELLEIRRELNSYRFGEEKEVDVSLGGLFDLLEKGGLEKVVEVAGRLEDKFYSEFIRRREYERAKKEFILGLLNIASLALSIVSLLPGITLATAYSVISLGISIGVGIYETVKESHEMPTPTTPYIGEVSIPYSQISLEKIREAFYELRENRKRLNEELEKLRRRIGIRIYRRRREEDILDSIYNKYMFCKACRQSYGRLAEQATKLSLCIDYRPLLREEIYFTQLAELKKLDDEQIDLLNQRLKAIYEQFQSGVFISRRIRQKIKDYFTNLQRGAILGSKELLREILNEFKKDMILYLDIEDMGLFWRLRELFERCHEVELYLTGWT